MPALATVKIHHDDSNDGNYIYVSKVVKLDDDGIVVETEDQFSHPTHTQAMRTFHNLTRKNWRNEEGVWKAELLPTSMEGFHEVWIEQLLFVTEEEDVDEVPS